MMLFEAIALTIFCSTVVLYLALKTKPTRERYADNPTMDAAIAGLMGDTRPPRPLHEAAEDIYKQVAEHIAKNHAHFDAIRYRYPEPPGKPYRDGGIVHAYPPRKVFGKRPPDYVALHANAAQVSANAALVAGGDSI